ncbi:MAG TPA: glycosyltransferase [Candidatus Sulfotelmatobacter sp.]|nr:glycosyltransferase [Candidatus Sulfotelmatobacter sp.]
MHVEVGGSYGGSLGALEVYLAHSNRKELVHDLLFYYPTPNAEKLSPHVGKLSTLYSAIPAWLSEGSRSEHDGERRQGRLARLRGVSALRGWASVIKQLPTAVRLARVIRRGNYDVVHVNNTFTYQVPTLVAARFAGVPVVAHVRNPVLEGPGVRFFARRANCLVSVAEVHSENLRKMDGSLRVITCHDGVESIFPRAESVEALRHSLVNDGDILVGSLGRLDPQKGFEFLIEAAARVVTEVPNVRFAIAGEGSQRKQLQELIDSLGLQENFRLIGFRTDFADFLAALDIFAVSSLWEGLPLALLEAMQLRKPAVATVVGGIPEVIQDRVSGLLVPPRDAGKLATAILELVRDPGLGSRLGSAGPQTAEPFCDLEARARELDSIFLSASEFATQN